MSKGFVLISGLNGFIAAVTAKHLLDAGYKVRGTVRRSSSANPLIEGPLKSYYQSGALEVVEVPDITADGAFDEAVKGVTAIAHLATPVSLQFKDPGPIIHAAVQGTKSILASSLKAGPQLQTFLQLSSVVAILTNAPPPTRLTENDWNEWAEAVVAKGGDNIDGVAIYAASKTASERAFWAFKEEHKPHFAFTALNPVFVIGAPLIPPKTKEEVGVSVKSVWAVFSGAPYEAGARSPFPVTTVDVHDVADLVEAMIRDPKRSDGQRYIASSALGTPQALADILRKSFPDSRERIAEGKPGVGYRADYQADPEKDTVVDSSKGRALLGRDWIPYEQSVIDTAKSFAHLV